MKLSSTLLASSLLRFGAARPAHADSAVVMKADVLLDTYDFIVVGAGTAGLTVADRLSEKGNYTVLAIEYGYLDSSPDIIATGPGSKIVGINSGLGKGSRFYNLSSQPLTNLTGQPYQVSAGCLVGGSSAVNGMVFDRGSAEDYDSWVWAAGENYTAAYGQDWGWKNMFPMFRKSTTFHPPTEQMQKDYQMTYDMAAWGGSTPIHSSYTPFQWPAQQLMWNAWKQIPGVVFPKEHADGNALGVVYVPNSIEPVNRTRSFAKLGHFDNGPSSRPNFHLLPGHRVTLLDTTVGPDSKLSVTGVYIAPRDGPMPGPQLLKARREIILSAGTVHTPQILQRSGIGPANVLAAAGVKLRLELPGVGANLQDHAGIRASFRFTKPVLPDESTLVSNKSFQAEATLLWNTNRTGPLAAYVSSMALLPLPVLSNRSAALVAALLDQAASPAAHLPPDTHPTILSGYAAQLRTLARQLVGNRTAALEFPIEGRSAVFLYLLKPLSRGTVHLAPDDDGTDPAARGDREPRLDWRTLSNPLDAALLAEFLRFGRSFMASPGMVASLAPEETFPGVSVGDGQADLEAWVRRSSVPSNGHMVGTAAMAPRELGGVVGPGLTVHGTVGLSVADNSIITLIPGTHTSSTAYAIGEKAAEMILRRANNKNTN